MDRSFYYYLKKWGELLSLLWKYHRGEVITWISRDLDHIPSWWSYSSDEKVGIILQGPIIAERDYTLRFARYYKRVNPNAEVVVSTWDSKQSRKQKLRFAKFGISVLLNSTPPEAGRANVNLQIISTLRGLEYLKELDISLAIKTRTDQVLANPRFFEVFFKHQNELKKNNKIVVTSFNSFSSPTITLSDMVQFGSTESLMKFWSSLDEQEWKTEVFKSIPEIFLVTRYIRKVGNLTNSKMMAYELTQLRDFFDFVDSNEIDQVWIKRSNLDIKGYWRMSRRQNMNSDTLLGITPKKF